MIIKEIHVGITYPYQLASYMYGRVELATLVSVEEGEDPDQVKRILFDKLLKQCKNEAITIVHGHDAQLIEEKTSDSSRRRRF